MATPCTFYKANADEYRAVPTPEGSVFYIARAEDGMTRRTRGWVVGTRIDGDLVAFTHPSHNDASRTRGVLTFDTLREAKEAVRRMARFGASASAARTYLGMVERGEGLNARRLISSWLSGRSDVLAQFMPARTVAVASGAMVSEEEYAAGALDTNEVRAERGNAAVHLHPDLGKVHDDAREDYLTAAGDIVADVLHATTPEDPEEFLAQALRTYRGDLAHDAGLSTW